MRGGGGAGGRGGEGDKDEDAKGGEETEERGERQGMGGNARGVCQRGEVLSSSIMSTYLMCSYCVPNVPNV